MPATVTGLRYPCTRVLLPRTKLAYVHLKNLLTDAKRDRGARVSGYVAIWLPEEFLVLYLQRGELVNACLHDGHTFQPIAIGAAIEKVPMEPEYGEICFHETDDEQLACMYASQTVPSEGWPPELRPSDPASLFPYLMASTFDGMVEISHDGAVNYLMFANGVVQNSYLAGMQGGSIVERVSKLFDEKRRVLHMSVRRWPMPPAIPVQAPTGLVQAYRDLATSLVLRLVAEGRDNAPAVAEQARQKLLAAHPALEGISFSGRAPRAVVADASALTSGTAALINQLLWSTGEQDPERPAAMLRDLMHERRHLFQSAGLYEQIHWKLT